MRVRWARQDTLSLPTPTDDTTYYVVSAEVSLRSASDHGSTAFCTLSIGSASPDTTEEDSDQMSFASSTATGVLYLSANGPIAGTDSTTAQVDCYVNFGNTGTASASDVRLTAIQVGSLTTSVSIDPLGNSQA